MADSEEDFFVEEETEDGPLAIKKLREKLAIAVKEKQEYLEGWQRARADLVNFKKEELNLQREREARVRAELAEAIIPTLDSFEMAFKSPSFEKADAEWKRGIQALYQNLQDSLARIGIKPFSSSGEKFDPYKHEAIREIKTMDEAQEHFIENTEHSGYTLDEKIIRPAQVSVYVKKG